MKIDSKTYKLTKDNYYQIVQPKSQIILAGSLRKDNFHIKRFEKKEYGKTKKWCTYSISRDGTVFEHFDPKYYSDFYGKKEIDKKSVSIVLENMGLLTFDYPTSSYVNWVNEICDEECVFDKNWKGNRYWEEYTKKQFDSVISLSDYLFKKIEIERNCIGYNVFFRNTKDFKGIVTRSNYSHDYNDLNPSFDFNEFTYQLGIEKL